MKSLEKLYGPTGKKAVCLALALSQFGFCCAYIYFIKENYSMIGVKIFNLEPSQNWYKNLEIFRIAFGLFFIFTGLCLIRKLEIFSATHIFSDFMILITIIYIVIQGSI